METSLREFAEFQDADEVLLFERATFLGIFIKKLSFVNLYVYIRGLFCGQHDPKKERMKKF
jgi:hypothetical protein